MIPALRGDPWDLIGHMLSLEPITEIRRMEYTDGHVTTLSKETCEQFTLFLGWELVWYLREQG